MNKSESNGPKKRKRSVLSKLKKYGKKQCYGRGFELDADTYQYFVRVLETFKQGFPSDEEKEIFVENVFQQTENQEINYSSNQIGCRAIETLVHFVGKSTINRYMEAFSPELRKLCSDRFASHVIEAIVIVCSQRSLNGPEQDREEYKAHVIKVAKFLLNNLEDYIWDTYGNPVIRTVLRSLSFIANQSNDRKQQQSNMKIEVENIPYEYTEIIKDYAGRLITWPQLKDMPYSELTSALLQVLLRALVVIDSKLLKKYLKKFLKESFTIASNLAEDDANANPKLFDVFVNKSAIILLETCLQVATPKMYTQLYLFCFKGNLGELIKLENVHFSVQKLIENCPEVAEFEAIYEELSPIISTLVDVGQSGVILALAQACKRFSKKQGSFMEDIIMALNCDDQREDCLIKSLISFSKFQTRPNCDRLHLHGVLIVETLLEFNKPIKVITSILNLENAALKKIFLDRMGCHIVDCYASSQFVGEKNKDKLVRKMQGSFQELASSKYGSRSFEALWNMANWQLKLQIMEEISAKSSLWCNSEFGKIIAGKLNLVLYCKKKDEWINQFQSVGSNKAKSLYKLLEQ